MRAYLQLVRLPNVFTAIADIVLGYMLTHRFFESAFPFALLLSCSCLLYLAGMVLNDYFDREQDFRERPFRPIPSGRVSVETAKRLGFGLLVGGVLVGWLTTVMTGDWRPGVLATLLATAVYGYDGVFKQTYLAPVVMGGCRTLNVLLGMSVAVDPWRGAHWAAALGIGVYIVGVTTFARSEARESGRGQLTLGLGILLFGLATVASMPVWATGAEWPPIQVPHNWYVFWGLLAGLLGYRCVKAIRDPSPKYVQPAVRNCILALIVIDAAAVMATQSMIWGVAILLLLAPMLLLGRWLYST